VILGVFDAGRSGLRLCPVLPGNVAGRGLGVDLEI
jgi:hypothetical protein